MERFVKELNQIIYGKRSENLGPDERQPSFQDIKLAQSEIELPSDPIEITAPRNKHKPAQRNLGNLMDQLEHIEVFLEPDRIVCTCGCGDMIRIGEDRYEWSDIIPALPEVVVTSHAYFLLVSAD